MPIGTSVSLAGQEVAIEEFFDVLGSSPAVRVTPAVEGRFQVNDFKVVINQNKTIDLPVGTLIDLSLIHI